MHIPPLHSLGPKVIKKEFDDSYVILLQFAKVSPGTRLMKNHESQSRINESQVKTQRVLTTLKDARTVMKPDNHV